MILSDRDIKENIKSGKIKIEPFDIETQVSPIGVDLRLSRSFRIFKVNTRSHIDLSVKNFEPDTDLIFVPEGNSFIVHPGEFVLGMTVEKVELPNDLMAHIDGRSSLGRLGIIVHSTSGHVDPGYKGNLTLEISNIGKLPVGLIPGMRFCSLIFQMLSSEAEKSYQGKYIGTETPGTSKINEEFK